MKQFLALLLLLTGCASAPKNRIMQVSTIDALLAGAYDGQMTLGELKTHGDLGIGTFDALEGEMIIFGDTIYQARADGTVHEMPDHATTPFAATVHFDPDQIACLKDPENWTELKKQIDQRAPNKNHFLAFRFDAHFPSMKVRSVPRQQKPYPPLVDVVKEQAIFEHQDIVGTIIGFRCPAYVKGINVPDYHAHFLSNDHKQGGHILDFTSGSGPLQLDLCNQLLLVLTDRAEFSTLDLSQDRSHELEKVEQ
jgi:acetolactate decarboxylase